MNTPDTEWGKEFDEKYKWFSEWGEEMPKDTYQEMKNDIKSLLSSRDTYWKERLQKERAEERHIILSELYGTLGAVRMRVIDKEKGFTYLVEKIVSLAEQSNLPEATEEAHYEERAGMPLWVTYTDGQEVVEPYKHQDGMYAKMCASPNYCRCTE